MLDTKAKHNDYTALGNLALEPVEKLCSLGAILKQFQRMSHFRLRGLQKRKQLCQIYGVVAVVVRAFALLASLIDQRFDDESFETFFVDICHHYVSAPLTQPFLTRVSNATRICFSWNMRLRLFHAYVSSTTLSGVVALSWAATQCTVESNSIP